jgi:hypothetical protein
MSTTRHFENLLKTEIEKLLTIVRPLGAGGRELRASQLLSTATLLTSGQQGMETLVKRNPIPSSPSRSVLHVLKCQVSLLRPSESMLPLKRHGMVDI